MKTTKLNVVSSVRAPRNIQRATTLAIAALVSSQCASVHAVGLRDPNQDPEAIARGDAFVATADNPSAIYYNPAGITQLPDSNLRVGLYTISADTKYTSPTGQKAETDTSYQAVPAIFYTYTPVDSPLSFGVGIYSPFGLSLNWGKSNPFNTLAQDGRIEFFTFEPVVAWRVCTNLSLALGPAVNYSRATLDQAIFGVPGGRFKFDGSGVGFGVNLGAMWQPIDKLSFGLSYHSPTRINYAGESQTLPSPPLPGQVSTHASAEFPQFVIGGVSFRPTPNWNLEADVDWTDWDKLDKVVFRHTAFGNVPFAFNYQSSFIYDFGITRELGKGYFASVGYIYSENSIPNKHFNPLNPDSNLQLGSIGLGHRGQRWDWAASWHFGVGERHVNNAESPNPFQTADGHYKSFNNAFDLAATYKF